MVNVNPDNSLCSDDPLVNLQIAHIMFVELQYNAAANHLRAVADASLADKHILDILMYMAEMQDVGRHRAPNAFAVMARASLLLATLLQGELFDERSSLYAPAWQKHAFCKRMIRALGRYGALSNKVDSTLRLTLAEEKAAWKPWDVSEEYLSQQELQRRQFVGIKRRSKHKLVVDTPVETKLTLNETVFKKVIEPERETEQDLGQSNPNVDAVSADSVPVLHPGPLLKSAFSTLLEVALGSDTEAQGQLRERLLLMGSGADNSSLNMRSFLFLALEFSEEAAPLLRRRRTEGYEGSDFSKLKALYQRLPSTYRLEAFAGGLQPGKGVWPAVSIVAAAQPVYQPRLAPAAPDSQVKRFGEAYLKQFAVAHLPALPKSLYPESTTDPLYEQVASIDANVALFAQENATVWTLADPEKLPEIMRGLTALGDPQKVQAQAKWLVDFANHVPGDEQALARLRLETLGRLKEPITMAQMMALFAQENLGELARINPSLAPEALDKLNQNLLEHLLFRSRCQHVLRLLDLGQSILAHTGDGDGLDAKRRDFAAMLAQERTFDPVLRPASLVLECAGNMLLRPRQTQTLDALDSQAGINPAAVVQLNMGEGKTKVLMPLRALRHADGRKLAMVVVPPSLLKINRRDLQKTTGDVFSQFGQVFEFEAGDEKSLGHLGFLWNLLESARTERRYVLTTRRSIAALRLQHRVLLLKAEAGDGNSKQGERIWALGRIIHMIRKHGHVLVDEADQALDVCSQVTFSTGPSASIDGAHINLMVRIYQAMTVLPKARFLANLQENRQSLMDGAQSAELKRTVAQHVLSTYPTLRAFSGQAALFDFVIGRASALPASISAALAGEGPSSTLSEAIGLLCLLRGQLNEILPLTLKRNGGEHYGPAKKTQQTQEPSRLDAVPYLRGQPLEKTDFGHPHEAINCTIQMYLQGLRLVDWTEIRGVLQKLQRRVAAEAAQDNCKWHQTEAATQYKQLLADTPYASETLPQILSDEAAMVAIAGFVQSDTSRLFFYLEHFVLPSNKVHLLQMTSDSRDFVDSFALVEAWTGIPWDHATYPIRMQKFFDNETDGITANALFDPNKTQTISVPNPTVASILDRVGNTRLEQGNIHALIDAGAIFKGVSNVQVARQLAEYWRHKEGSPLKGILYFDDDSTNLAMFLLHATQPLVLSGAYSSVLRDTGLEPEQIFTFYDQSHTFGADIPQPPRATGILTVGELTFLRDMQQGLLRMRQISKQQRCVLVASSSLIESLGSDGVGALYRHCLVNQTRQLSGNKVMAIQQELKGLVQTLIADELSVLQREDSIALMYLARELMYTKTTDSPLEEYGQSELAETRQIIDAFARELAQTILGVASQMSAPVLQQLKSRLVACADAFADPAFLGAVVGKVGTLPKQSRRMGTSRREATQMIERQVQQQVAKQVAKQVAGDVSQLAVQSRDWQETNPYDEAWLRRDLRVSQDGELKNTVLAQTPSKDAVGVRGNEDFNVASGDTVVCSRDLAVGSLLDPNIWLTLNLLVSTNLQHRDILTSDQKPVHFVLAVQDTDANGKSTVRAVFGAKEDASFFGRQIKDAKLARRSRRKLTLCDEHGVKLVSGVRPVDDDILAGDAFQSYLAQAKAISQP